MDNSARRDGIDRLDRRKENRALIRWLLVLGVAAFFVSISTSIAVLLFMIGYGQELAKRDVEIARLRGIVEARLQMESALRTEIQTWQAYVFGLQKRMIENGVENVPDLPESSTKRRK